MPSGEKKGVADERAEEVFAGNEASGSWRVT